jgi:hypothetical protein
MQYVTHPYFSKAVKVLASAETGAQWCVAMTFVDAASAAYAREHTGDATRVLWPGFTDDVYRAVDDLDRRKREGA